VTGEGDLAGIEIEGDDQILPHRTGARHGQDVVVSEDGAAPWADADVVAVPGDVHVQDVPRFELGDDTIQIGAVGGTQTGAERIELRMQYDIGLAHQLGVEIEPLDRLDQLGSCSLAGRHGERELGLDR